MKTQLHSTAAPSHRNHTTAHLFARRACLWAALGLLAVQAFVARPAQAAVTEAWVYRYNGPANRDDGALAVDGSGNVLVTGASYTNFIFNGDYYTAKYAATNGALLWEKRYNGPANGNEYILARSLALGPNEMVAITGLSDGTFNALTAPNCATILYREILPPVSIAADGAGGYFIRGSCIAGSIHQLQRATAVTGPWMSNATMTAASPAHRIPRHQRAVRPSLLSHGAALECEAKDQ